MDFLQLLKNLGRPEVRVNTYIFGEEVPNTDAKKFSVLFLKGCASVANNIKIITVINIIRIYSIFLIIEYILINVRTSPVSYGKNERNI